MRRQSRHATPGSRRRLSSGLATGLALLLVGCTHIGPGTVMRDRFDFGTAVAESWKQQTLLNIVKLRYLDLPVFLDVGQIVSGYTLETGIDLSGQLAPVNRGDTFAGLGGHGTFTDRPTITYTPLTGDKFLRGLMSPIPTASILYTLQSGYAADFVLGWTVESLNGLHNRAATPPVRPADPAFVRALELMREIQVAGGINLGVEKGVGKDETTVAVFRAEDLPQSTLDKSAELRRLLHLPIGQVRFQVVTSPGRGPAGELAMQPRSLLQVLLGVGAFVEVPPEHLARQWAMPGAEIEAEEGSSPLGVRIRSSRQKPAQPYAAVRYKGHWFWIDQSDWRTKRTLAMVILLFTLTNSGEGERLPVLTIPTS